MILYPQVSLNVNLFPLFGTAVGTVRINGRKVTVRTTFDGWQFSSMLRILRLGTEKMQRRTCQTIPDNDQQTALPEMCVCLCVSLQLPSHNIRFFYAIHTEHPHGVHTVSLSIPSPLSLPPPCLYRYLVGSIASTPPYPPPPSPRSYLLCRG